MYLDDDKEKKLFQATPNINLGNLLIDKQPIHYAYTDQKKDQLVVFIHESPGSWDGFSDFFTLDTLFKNFDLISIDRPGFGKSGFGEAEKSLEKQAFYMAEVIRQFSHQKIILVGHSLGTPIIARMAMDYPDVYVGIVLVGSSIDPEMGKQEWYRPIINTYIGSLLTPKIFEVSNDEIIPLKNELTKMISLWKDIKIPTVIIHGTDDSLVPVANVTFAQRILINSRVTVIVLDGVNHFIPWSNPSEITKAIYLLINDQ